MVLVDAQGVTVITGRTVGVPGGGGGGGGSEEAVPPELELVSTPAPST